MDGLQKRACARCRMLKMKCDRAVPACTRCQKSGQSCNYATDKPVRFRNETQTAAHRAVKKWRARAKSAHEDDDNEKQVLPVEENRMQYNFALPIDELAHMRFLHDFVDVDSGQFFRQMRGMLPMKQDSVPRTDETALSLALSAVSLGNFHKRQYHEPSSNLAWATHGKALAALSNVIQRPSDAISYDTVLMAIFLGIFQNIYQEMGLKGAWISHLKGAIDLLKHCPREIDPGRHRQLSTLLMKMMVAACLRMNLSASLPPALSYWLHQKQDMESRSMILAFRVAALSSARHDRLKEDHSESYRVQEQMASLERDLNVLETDVQNSCPFERIPARGNEYPRWYWPVSKFPGGPSERHTYEQVKYGTIWNYYRMTRLKLLSVLFYLQPELDQLPEEQESRHSGILREFYSLVDDICASVYPILTRKQDGKAAPSSFAHIPSARAMGLISPLNEAAVGLERNRELGEYYHPGRIAWIKHVLRTLRQSVGIAEPLIMNDEEDEERRRMIQELFQFDE